MVKVQGVPVEGVVDTGADIMIVGGSVFKQVAAVAKLRKKSFKPPDRTPRTYDRKPFRLDGRLDLDVSFGDKTLNTPVYVKMDASEPLLLSAGVCRQLGIVSYHPDVHPKNAKPETPNVAEATTIAVPSVRIKLVTSVRLPPNEAVAAEVQLEGTEENYRGPWLLQSNDTVVEDIGVCVIDSLVTPTADATTKVVLTNHLGISQKAEAGMIVGNALPAELIEPNSSCLSPVSSDGRFDDSCEALSLAEVRDISSDDSRAEWRENKLGELAVDSIRAAQARYKHYYDKKSRPVTLKLGDWVLIRFPQDEAGKQRKLSRPWHGPYRVTQRNDPDVTAIKVYYPDEGPIQVHQSRVCPCPPKLPAGFYWYGGRRKSPGRIPQWVHQLFTSQDEHSTGSPPVDEHPTGNPQVDTHSAEEPSVTDELPVEQPLTDERLPEGRRPNPGPQDTVGQAREDQRAPRQNASYSLRSRTQPPLRYR